MWEIGRKTYPPIILIGHKAIEWYESDRNKVRSARKDLDDFNRQDTIDDLKNAKEQEAKIYQEAIDNYSDYLKMLEYLHGEAQRIQDTRLAMELFGVTSEADLQSQMIANAVTFNEQMKTLREDINFNQKIAYESYIDNMTQFLTDGDESYTGKNLELQKLKEQELYYLNVSDYSSMNEENGEGMTPADSYEKYTGDFENFLEDYQNDVDELEAKHKKEIETLSTVSLEENQEKYTPKQLYGDYLNDFKKFISDYSKEIDNLIDQKKREAEALQEKYVAQTTKDTTVDDTKSAANEETTSSSKKETSKRKNGDIFIGGVGWVEGNVVNGNTTTTGLNVGDVVYSGGKYWEITQVNDDPNNNYDAKEASASVIKNIEGRANGIEGGPVTYTGLTMLHGTQSNPEYVLTNDQAYNLLRYMATSKPEIISNNSDDVSQYVVNGNIVLEGVNDPVEFWNEVTMAMDRKFSVTKNKK